MATAQNLLTLPHGHLYPKFFPKDFKGKIMFIQRDPRAVAASAYPFLQKVSGYFHLENSITCSEHRFTRVLDSTDEAIL